MSFFFKFVGNDLEKTRDEYVVKGLLAEIKGKLFKYCK